MHKMLIGYIGLARKEIARFWRVWPQTLIPPVITALLYFLIFGRVIGARIGAVDGVSYMAYIVPGLVMMAIITNSFTNVVFSFYMARFSRTMDDLLISPMKNQYIIFGYITAGILRGMLVAVMVLIIGLFFSGIHVVHPVLLLLIAVFTGLMFALAGLVNGVFAKSFDDTTIATTFILTPLIYLGGVFYNIKELTGVWYKISIANPIYYIVEGFRYAMLGSSVTSINICFGAVILCIVILFTICLYLLNHGIRLKE